MEEKVLHKNKNGMVMLLICLLVMMVCIAGFIWGINMGDNGVWIGIPCLIIAAIAGFMLIGLKVLRPQEALVLTLFGKYIGNWGGNMLKFVFEGYKDGKLVKTVTKTSFKKLHMEIKCSSGKLFEKDTYDVAAVRIAICDEYGNVQPFFCDSLPLEIKGNGEIIGPSGARISGGYGGTYIKSSSKGKITLKISCPDGYEGIFEDNSRTLELEVCS